MTEEKETRPEDREVETIFGWCTTGECEKCIVWNRWVSCIYVCSHDCHKGKERPALAPLAPPWDALPKTAKKKAPPKRPAKQPAPESLTEEPAEGMIEPEPVQEDGTETTEET